jgi:hypothetical protein
MSKPTRTIKYVPAGKGNTKKRRVDQVALDVWASGWSGDTTTDDVPAASSSTEPVTFEIPTLVDHMPTVSLPMPSAEDMPWTQDDNADPVAQFGSTPYVTSTPVPPTDDPVLGKVRV